MKKSVFFLSIFTISSILLGCTKTNVVEEAKSEMYRQKIIILDSVNAPLPSDVQNVEYMPNALGPQQIPNADLTKPIIITKMPNLGDKSYVTHILEDQEPH